jgi:hypothetical protein
MLSRLVLLQFLGLLGITHAFLQSCRLATTSSGRGPRPSRPLVVGGVSRASVPGAEGMTAEDVVADARKSLDKAYLEVDMRTKRVLKRVLTSFRKHQVGA